MSASRHRTWSLRIAGIPIACTLATGLPPPSSRAAATPAADAVPACPANAGIMDGWDERAPPRKIFGNTYYVGTCGITALLIVGHQGAILIDGSTDRGATAIEANIRALGFQLRDVKRILGSHEHGDHAGGLSRLQRDTGAPVLARLPAATTLRRGTPAPDDPQYGELPDFPAVANIRVIADGQRITLGDLTLQAHATPGHAPGGTSWTWQSCEGPRCVTIAYVDSHSAASNDHYRFADHPAYLAAFRHSLESVSQLSCDILLTPHPLASNLPARLAGKAPLVDAAACRRFAIAARANLDARVDRERTQPAPSP